MRRFATTLDSPAPGTNEYQRADAAPRSTFGDGFITAGDVTQARRYAVGLDPPTDASGPNMLPAVPVPSIFEALYTPLEYFAMRKIAIGAAEFGSKKAVTVPIEITPSGDEVAVIFVLEYDPDQLGDPSVNLGNAFSNDAVLTVNMSEKGRIVILVDSGTVMKVGDKRRIVNVEFAVVGNYSTDPKIAFGMTSADQNVSDAFGNLLPAIWMDSKPGMGRQEK